MTANSFPPPIATEAPQSQDAQLGVPVGGVPQRQAALAAPLRAFHRGLLAGFLIHLGPPGPPAIASLAAELGLQPGEALTELAAADLVHTDPDSGTIAVAYPFSGRPSPHQVELAGGPTVASMCALDALGIPQMTGRDARISSTDPSSGQPITVEVYAGTWRFAPTATVVLIGTAANADCGLVADACCPHINFHADPEHAQTYLQAHPGMTGKVLDQAEAVEAARRIFGGLLNPHAQPGLPQQPIATDDNDPTKEAP
jgi:hypothetical protein